MKCKKELKPVSKTTEVIIGIVFVMLIFLFPNFFLGLTLSILYFIFK